MSTTDGRHSESRAVERLQRLLMPRKGEPSDVRSLYVEETERAAKRLQFDDRFHIRIAQGGEVSFETYFNAFPASYWRRWTQLDSVVLRLSIEGSGRVDVYRSRIDGGRIAVDSADVVDSAVEFELSLAPFEDGGWYWFDVTAESDVSVSDGGWYAPQAPGPQVLPDGTTVGPQDKRVAVGIPTFNRPADAVAALEALASDAEVDGIIDAIIMPDQGTKHPADEPGYAEVTGHFGDRFHEFRQGNLGGSGGYSRIMYEGLNDAVTTAPFILYMDDDIAIEPDSVLRAVQIARYASSPILVGGQMLNLLNRSELRTMGEVVDRGTFMWSPAPHVHYDHDFSRHPLSDRYGTLGGDGLTSRNLHRRIDVEFNGWWMCLIPRVVAQRIGQPLPLFIKWDDTEYSLRASAHGFPTATWPGVAIWHMSWSDKDDAIDWQAYFHLRNRLIVAALYHDASPAGLIRTLYKSAFKHLMCMEYSTLAIQLKAMDDFLAGPDRLFGILESALPEVNAIRQRYSDARVVGSAKDLPRATGAPGVPLYDRGGITQKPRKVGWLLKGLRHNLRQPDPAHHDVPQLNLTPEEARWYSLCRVDSATVTTAGNNGVVLRRRDREEASRLLRETVAHYREIGRRFDEMRAVWRAALPQLASRDSWREVFDAQ